MGGFSRRRWGRSMGRWCIRIDGKIPSAEILRECCEGEAAADCSVSALPLLETFLESVSNSSILAPTSLCGLFTGT